MCQKFVYVDPTLSLITVPNLSLLQKFEYIHKYVMDKIPRGTHV